jgi:tetratricopeptide (TPR) repeat protein
MNNNSTNTDLLIQYMDGELQGDDLRAAEQKIAADRQLGIKLEQLGLAKAAITSYGLKKRVGSIHAEMMKELDAAAAPPRIGIRRIMQYTLRIAAMLVIVIGATALYQFFAATPQQLFSDNYTPFSLHETRGSAGSSAVESLYKKGDFNGAMAAFSTVSTPVAGDYFLNGCAALSVGNAPEAIRSFLSLQQKNAANNTHLFEEDASYYLGLAYLRNNEPAKALPIFEHIHADPGHPYHRKISSWWLQKLQRLARNK